MKTDVDLIKNTNADLTAEKEILVEELSEDMEMVSPGAMLKEARKALSLSQAHIATKLNFKVSLVQSIEEDQFDPALPATFNRGYLTNYAKLVNVDVVDVLASYDALDAASIQRSEMLSFSKETTKQAEHSRVMWVSYLIIAIFIGLTIVWWLQENSQKNQSSKISKPKTDDVIMSVDTVAKKDVETNTAVVTPTASNKLDVESVDSPAEETVLVNDSVITNIDTEEALSEPTTLLSESLQSPPPVISKAVFTFKGDCWVNIFDADGERIAWGMKKAGYVMPIEGKAPLKVTVGKPELTSITFNDQPVDMSVFNTGNIAKFSLPLDTEVN